MLELVKLLIWVQGLLLTTYLKFLIADPGDTNLKALAEDVFNKYSRYGEPVHNI